MKTTHIPILGVFVLAGCGGTPDCGSDDALDLVIEITENKFVEYLMNSGIETAQAQARHKVALMKIMPTMVRMTDYNEQIDTYSCSTTLTGTSLKGDEMELQITFKVSPSATDGDFIVEVFGLN